MQIKIKDQLLIYSGSYLLILLILISPSLGLAEQDSSSSNAISRVIVISDADDTIKVSHTNSLWRMIWEHTGEVKAYDRLIDIYNEINDYYLKAGLTVDFFYLSASPKLVRLSKWLKRHHAPEGAVCQKGYSELIESAYEFKIRKGKKYLLDKISSLSVGSSVSGGSLIPPGKIKLLLFGDNSESDPLVYKNLVKDLDIAPFVQAEIFIRKVVKEKNLLDKINYFRSEYDLVNENELMSLIISPALKKKIFTEYEQGVLIPEYIAR